MVSILGGMEPATFLREHWQKKPLLVRQAFPGFAGLLDVEGLFALAERDDAVSRMVVEHKPTSAAKKKPPSEWEMEQGPFEGLSLDALPPEDWTVLVQGVETLIEGAWPLLNAFDFLPAARVDDLMISYAAPGGSVGAHVDKYDVFLLQGPGRRRWQIDTRGGWAVDEEGPLRLLKDFRAEEEWVLEPGDMLYLPPGVGHWGTAVDGCFTYSIGFVAPTHEGLVQNFLAFLGHKVKSSDALYSDPDLQPPARRHAVPDAMVDAIEQLVTAGIRWTRADVEEFAGRLLTGPKPNVAFAPPAKAMSVDAFSRKLKGKGALKLALPTRGLVRAGHVYVNGEDLDVGPAAVPFFEALLQQRSTSLPCSVSDATCAVLCDLFNAGYLTLTGR